jgi:hypothetical protein
VQVAIHTFLREPGAEKVGVAANASTVVSESAGLGQSLLGLPVDFGGIQEKLAVNILAPQASFLGVIAYPPAGEVAINAMGHHTALVGEMRRANPSLRGVRVGMAGLVAELVRRGDVHARFSRQNDRDANANPDPDEKQAFVS